MEPAHFDEEFMDKHGMDGEITEVFGAHCHINKLLGDLQFKRMDDFIDGASNYRSRVSVVHSEYNSLTEDHPLQGNEIVMLCFGQEHDIDVEIDGEKDTTEEHADGIAYMTPEQAREVADNLHEYADTVEEINEDNE